VAQSTTSTSAPASATASIYPGTSTWEYIGCYNETDAINGTGGLRALNGGPDEVLANMTVGECLSFCSGNAYAGLEYSRYANCPSEKKDLLTRLSVGNAGVLNIFPRSPPNCQTHLAISPAREIALRSVEGLIN
jgi:hypothetical protein